MHTVFHSDNKLIELEKVRESLELQLQEMAKTVERQQELIALAKRDPLTGLRNRQGIPELVNTRLHEEREGIFFIMDMDNFKSVNDTYGHIEGDKVLTRFARGLKKAVDADDITARLGGDEFVVFSPGHFDKYETMLQGQLAHLQHAIVSSLRKGDVTAKYSSTQVLALLIDTNKGNADMVVKRILAWYCAEAGRDAMNVLYDIQQLMASEGFG